jgi:hypothetical protein
MRLILTLISSVLVLPSTIGVTIQPSEEVKTGIKQMLAQVKGVTLENVDE